LVFGKARLRLFQRQAPIARDSTAFAHPMRIALVSSFPPVAADLNEYGYHLARAMRQDALRMLTSHTATHRLKRNE
jgi:hypothetical protein